MFALVKVEQVPSQMESLIQEIRIRADILRRFLKPSPIMVQIRLLHINQNHILEQMCFVVF